jgi:hypothetical protein
MTTPSIYPPIPNWAVVVPYMEPRCARLQALTSAFCQAASTQFPTVGRSTLRVNEIFFCEGKHRDLCSLFCTAYAADGNRDARREKYSRSVVRALTGQHQSCHARRAILCSKNLNCWVGSGCIQRQSITRIEPCAKVRGDRSDQPGKAAGAFNLVCGPMHGGFTRPPAPMTAASGQGALYSPTSNFEHGTAETSGSVDKFQQPESSVLGPARSRRSCTRGASQAPTQTTSTARGGHDHRPLSVHLPASRRASLLQQQGAQ